MDHKRAFKTLLQIRNMRVDGMSRQLAELRSRRDVVAADLELVDRELREAADHVDALSSTPLLLAGQLISGKQLHERLHEIAVARTVVMALHERRVLVAQEHQREAELVDKLKERLLSATRVAGRTELVLNELEK